MQNINDKEPIFVDFGNAEEDGAIRLITNGTLADLERMNISLKEGQGVWLTDGDVEINGEIEFRVGMWVAVPVSKFTEVDSTAPHHISKNQYIN